MAITSKTEIWNLALSIIGSDKARISLPDDDTPEAIVLREHYELLRPHVLSTFNWGFARRYRNLSTNAYVSPVAEYPYVYTYPTDALALWRIPSGIRQPEAVDQRVPYQIAVDASGLRVVLTDHPEAVGEITIDSEQVTAWSPAFSIGLAFTLAAHVAGPLGRGDPGNLFQLAAHYMNVAQVVDANNQVTGPRPLAKTIRARGGGLDDLRLHGRTPVWEI